MARKSDINHYTAADIENLTERGVDRKMVENWHNRDLWLTPSDSPPRGTPRQYSIAHLFEAMTRAVLVDGGFTHAAARSAIEQRLVTAALDKEQRRTGKKRTDSSLFVSASDVPREIYRLPEIKSAEDDWYWVIYFRTYGEKVAEIDSTFAFRGKMPVSELFTISRVASVVHISAIVRDVFAYVERASLKG